MVMVSFLASVLFIEIGNTLGIDLGITTLLGWFVLASLCNYHRYTSYLIYTRTNAPAELLIT